MQVCVYRLGNQVSIGSNWRGFQVAWGGSVGCQGTKFGGAHVTQISLLSVSLSLCVSTYWKAFQGPAEDASI